MNLYALLFAPEATLVLGACAILLMALPQQRAVEARWAGYEVVAGVTWLACGLSLLGCFAHPTLPTTALWAVTAWGGWLKFGMWVAVASVWTYGRPVLQREGMVRPETLVLLLLSMVGGFAMVSAQHLAVLYVGLELMSLPLYALVAMRRREGSIHPLATEAALKYFVTGALASALMLYGMALWLGAAGGLAYADLTHALVQVGTSHTMVWVLGAVFVWVGFAFKFGLAPFHMWMPDVYHGAATPVTLWVALLPKLASLGACMVLFNHVLHPLFPHWQPLCLALVATSWGVGNVMALGQTQFKRMLAFSSMAHMGWLVAVLAAPGTQALLAGRFYVLTYVLTTSLVFAALMTLEASGEPAERIEDLRGLNQRSPLLAGVLSVGMFSLAGVPPLVGFMAKLGVLQVLLHAHLLWVAIVGMLAAVVGACYYVRVVRCVYVDGSERNVANVQVLPRRSLWLMLHAVLVVLLGLLPLGWL